MQSAHRKSEFGEAAKKMGKVAMAVSQSTSSVFKGDFGERESRPLGFGCSGVFPSYFSGGSRMSKPNLSRFELPLSQKRFPGAAPSLLLLSGE